MKKIIGLICLLLVGCSINGQEENFTETNFSGPTEYNKSEMIIRGAIEPTFYIYSGWRVSEDVHCVGEEKWSLCFVDTMLIELDKGVYALNLSYYRKANTSW